MSKLYLLRYVLLCVMLLWAVPIAITGAQDGDCNGAAALPLVIGARGRVLPGSANRMRAEPSTAGAEVGQIPGGDSFIVLDSPVCGDGFWWWQVNYNGRVGWTVQGTADEDWIEPLPAESVDSDSAEPGVWVMGCPDSIPSGLRIGWDARAITLRNINVRAEPSTRGQQVGVIEGQTAAGVGQIVSVIGGPECHDGFTWWQIDAGGQFTGWASRSDRDTARPVLDSTPFAIAATGHRYHHHPQI